MKTQVKALTSFMHGRTHAHAGDELELTKGEADELNKIGLVEIVGGNEQQSPVGTADAAPADMKMAEPVENKMDDAPANKSTRKK